MGTDPVHVYLTRRRPPSLRGHALQVPNILFFLHCLNLRKNRYFVQYLPHSYARSKNITPMDRRRRNIPRPITDVNRKFHIRNLKQKLDFFFIRFLFNPNICAARNSRNGYNPPAPAAPPPPRTGPRTSFLLVIPGSSPRSINHCTIATCCALFTFFMCCHG